MAEMHGVRHIHKDPVVFLQPQGRAEVTLWGPGVLQLPSAEAGPVGLHQGQRRGKSCSPHKHRVNKPGCGGAFLKDQLHSWVDVIESALVDLQTAILNPVGHSSREERLTYLRLPAQSLTEYLFFDPPCKKRGDGDVTMCTVDSRYHRVWLPFAIKMSPITCAAGRLSLSFPCNSGS